MTVAANIPLVNLKRQVETIYPELEQAFKNLLDKTDFVGGQAVGRFEENFAHYCQAKHCVGVGNGTDALYLIFRALNFEPGSEVIVPSMTFIATAEVLAPLGLKAVFADIDPVTYTMDPAHVETLITTKTRALMPVHLYGQPADMRALKALADKHGLTLIEDAAQAHGAEFAGQRIGSIGHAAGFSFYPGKNLGAFGDGGGVTTNDESLAHKVRMLANHGRMTKYEHEAEGVNSRLDTLQAAILDIKLARLDEWTRLRNQWANRYSELLADVPELTLPKTGADRTHVYHLYVMQTARRDDLLKHLQDQGIFGGIHYPVPLHLQPAFAYLGYKPGQLPVSEKLGRECISLPLFPEMQAGEVELVAKAVCQFFK